MSMATAYRMKRRFADGGRVDQDPPDPQSPGSLVSKSFKKALGYAGGGAVDSDGDHDNDIGETYDASKPGIPLVKDKHIADAEFGGGGRGYSLAEAHGGMIDRIMKKRCMSEGGEVANDMPPLADFMEADYDVLPEEDDLEEHYTAENSGDEDGGLSSDSMVDRLMLKRKRDRMPHPA